MTTNSPATTPNPNKIHYQFNQRIITPEGTAFALRASSLTGCQPNLRGGFQDMTTCPPSTKFNSQVTTIELKNNVGEKTVLARGNDVLFSRPNGAIENENRYCVTENYSNTPAQPAFYGNSLKAEQVCAALDQGLEKPSGGVFATDRADRDAAVMFGNNSHKAQDFTGATEIASIHVVEHFNAPFDGDYRPVLFAPGQEGVLDANGMLKSPAEFCSEDFASQAITHELPNYLLEQSMSAEKWCQGASSGAPSLALVLGLSLGLGLPAAAVLFLLCCRGRHSNHSQTYKPNHPLGNHHGHSHFATHHTQEPETPQRPNRPSNHYASGGYTQQTQPIAPLHHSHTATASAPIEVVAEPVDVKPSAPTEQQEQDIPVFVDAVILSGDTE